MSGIKRKLEIARMNAQNAKSRGAEGAWKVALARAARDAISLDLSVQSLQRQRRSLAELLEMPTERAMIIVLEGPKEGLGLVVLSAEVLSAMIEMQTIGQVSKLPPLPRKPTRTDAAMIAGLLDNALRGMETALEQDHDLCWTSDFHYASFLEDARPLGLLLEDCTYHVMLAEVSLAEGAKSGTVLLALPAAGKGREPVIDTQAVEAGGAMVFAAALEEQVLRADATLRAVMARVHLPLEAVLALKTGDPLPLGTAALDQIDLEGVDGCRVGGGKLGQNRGMRAVRMLSNARPAVTTKALSDPAKAAPLPKAQTSGTAA